MASPPPDPLRALDRVLAPLTWLIAAAAVAVLLIGPQMIGADKPGAEPAAAPASGEQIFASAGCGGCHTLAAAGASGGSGPNLDSLGPDAGTVVAVVKSGDGAMPSFEGRLSGAEIQAVADFVSSSAGR